MTQKTHNIQHVLDRFVEKYPKEIHCGDGWIPLILNCDKELAEIDKDYKIYQIKEKFGIMRYYIASSSSGLYDKMVSVVIFYENLSGRTCEISGTKGVLMVKNGVYKTLNPEIAPSGYSIFDPNNLKTYT